MGGDISMAASASAPVTRYLSLAEYLWLAEQVTGVEAAVFAKASRLDLAESALHALEDLRLAMRMFTPPTPSAAPVSGPSDDPRRKRWWHRNR